MDFVIELLPLSQRLLKERFALFELFLKQEARKLDRVLEVRLIYYTPYYYMK